MKSLSILTSKLTSLTPQDILSGGFIDKIELNVNDYNISVNYLKSTNVFYAREKREGRFHTLELFKNLDISAYYNRKGYIYKLKLNPSSEVDWITFYQKSKPLWHIFDLYKLKILRLDLTIDLREDFKSISSGIVVKYKQSADVFKKSKITGLNFGTGDEVIKVYNRSLKAKLPFDCTRIEILLKGKKLPFYTIKDFIKLVNDRDKFRLFNPFINISLNTLELKQNITTENELRAMYQLEITPYFYFKKIHNQNGNFNRNFKDIIKLSPKKIQPTEIIETGLVQFFKNTFNKTINELNKSSSLTIKYNKQQVDIRLLNQRSPYGN
jgi:hypothetical protein